MTLNRYPADETFDFGLAPGEQFDPSDDDAESLDDRQPHIDTVLGRIDPGDLGVTVWLDTTTSTKPWYQNPAAALSALEDAFQRGLRSLVIPAATDDVDAGHEIEWIAGRSPVHLIENASSHPTRSGFHVVPFNDAGRQRGNELMLLAVSGPPEHWPDQIERGPIDVMEAGYAAAEVRQMLIDHPLQALMRSGEQQESGSNGDK